jgi:hypothetical protein
MLVARDSRHGAALHTVVQKRGGLVRGVVGGRQDGLGRGGVGQAGGDGLRDEGRHVVAALGDFDEELVDLDLQLQQLLLQSLVQRLDRCSMPCYAHSNHE